MITIKTINQNKAELHIAEKTPHITILLGIEMLIEELMKYNVCNTIDDLLYDLKRIYTRDNK